MTEIERITDQLKRSFEGPSWHGPAVLEALQGVTAIEAARRPLAGTHTIWELVLHMAVWEDTVRRRALGEAFDPSAEQDWPAVTDTGEAAWREALRALQSGNLALRCVVAAYDPERLEMLLDPGGGTAYVQFHGAVQHDLWHAGQIVVLKKA
jgi:uncharacterized damage-inducible protein DinB